jgi:hypothetical protein
VFLYAADNSIGPQSGTIPPFHPRARGLCHDATPFVLPVGGLRIPVAVCQAARCLAQPMHDSTGNVSHAHHTAASTLQGPQAVCRPHPQAPLCPVCARSGASPSTAAGATQADAPDAPSPPHGGHLQTLLSPWWLSLARLAGAREPAHQRPSPWWPVATGALDGLRWLLSRASWDDLAWQTGDGRTHYPCAGMLGRGAG